MNAVTNNRLTVLAADIRAAHAAICRTTIEMAERTIAAGHMLIEAKAALVHGEWEDWLADHAGLSSRTARRYMQIARSGFKTATVADLGIGGAAKALATATRSETEDLDSNPDYVAWREEILRSLAKAPSQAARNEAIRAMREQLEVERFAARLNELSKPGELETLAGWLERADPKQVAKLIRSKLGGRA